MNNNDMTSRPTVSVNGFCLGKPELLLQIKEYFGLLSDIALLTRIQRHYAVVQRREPTSDELILTDRYLNSAGDPSRYALTSLSSDDTRVGEVYDDLRKKATELGKELPLTLTELFDFGGACLSSVGLEAMPGRVISGEAGLLSLCRRQGSSPALIRGRSVCGAVDLSPSAEPSAVTDRLVMISGDGDAFVNRLASLLLSGRERFTVGGVALCEPSVLDALMCLSPGGLIDLGALLSLHMTELAESRPASAVLTVAAPGAGALVAEAERFGLTACVFGRTDNFKRYSIVTRPGLHQHISTDFLKSTLPRLDVDAKVLRKAPLGELDGSFDILLPNEAGHAEAVACVGGRSLSAVGTPALSYDDACLTLVEGVSRLVAAGASYRDISASVELEFPRPGADGSVGDAVGALLGLYRAQAELCLRQSGGGLRFGEPRLGAIMTAPLDSPLPDRLTRSGNGVWLLFPRSDGSGLPRFDDLRRLYDYLHDAVRRGDVLSARAVGREGASTAVRRFIGDRNDSFDDVAMPKFALGGFVVEAENELDGLFLGISE